MFPGIAQKGKEKSALKLYRVSRLFDVISRVKAFAEEDFEAFFNLLTGWKIFSGIAIKMYFDWNFWGPMEQFPSRCLIHNDTTTQRRGYRMRLYPSAQMRHQEILWRRKRLRSTNTKSLSCRSSLLSPQPKSTTMKLSSLRKIRLLRNQPFTNSQRNYTSLSNISFDTGRYLLVKGACTDEVGWIYSSHF